MRLVPTSVLALVVGDLVTLDGTLPALTVVKVGRGLKQRNVTYRRADGEEFRFTHHASTYVDVVVLEPVEKAPAGAEVRVSGPGYGYVGTVQPADRWGRVHVVNGRSSWILQTGDRVEVLAQPVGEPVRDASLPSAWWDEPATGLHLEDGLCCAEDDHEGALDTSSSASRQHYIDTGHYGDRVVDGWLECSTCDRSAGNPAPSSEPTERSSAPFGVPAGYTVGDTVGWWVRLGGDAGDSTHEVPSLEAALDLWRETLEVHPLADIRVLTSVNGGPVTTYADVAEHDTCDVHRDAVFSKNGPCPVCVEEDDRWEDDPAGAEAAGDSATAAVLRSLLARDGQSLTLLPAERAALHHATYVLEG